MLNQLWSWMILVAVVCAFFTGNADNLTTGILTGAQDGVTLVLRLVGTMCLWNGIMKIAERSGLDRLLGKLLSPVLRLIFPKLDRGSEAETLISLNVSANLLGLGNAATPIGLKAMEEMQKNNPLRERATDEMVTFVVMNTASLTLIPTTVAMLRQENGAAAPMDILACVLVTSSIALASAIAVSKVFAPVTRREKKKKKRD